jgi:hypothetical protein
LPLALDPAAGAALVAALAAGRSTWGMPVDAGLGGVVPELPEAAGAPVAGLPPEGA